MPVENMLVVVGHMKHLQQMEEQLLADWHMNSKSKNTVLGPPAAHPVDGVRETTQAVAAVLVVQACPCPTAPSSLPVCLLNAISSKLSLAMMISTATNVVGFFFFFFLSSLLSLVAQRVWVSGEDVEES